VPSTVEVDFSRTARTYSGRIPYFQEFFDKVAVATGLDRESFVLDLACGRGEIATGLARHCGEVLGIDKSAEMLTSGRVPANVRLLRADLNSDAIDIPRPASLVTIGRAVPYLDPKIVIPFLDSATREDGAVLVCAAAIWKDVAWLEAYLALCRRYRRRQAAQGFAGRAFFRNSRWKLTRIISTRATIHWRPERLYRNALSHENLVQGILADQERFVQELKKILAPHKDEHGNISFQAMSWGVEYRRHAD
jgi:SAM-dependent methyltransferase